MRFVAESEEAEIPRGCVSVLKTENALFKIQT